MKKNVLVVLTDGFADWEASYITAELNKPESAYQVRTIGIDKEPKTSMGGFRVLPDYDLTEFVGGMSSIAMLIIPGGTGWREDKNEPFKDLVERCVTSDIPVAAICDATTFLANHGFLEHQRHTGNSLAYLKQGAPDYAGERYYVEAQSVSDGNFITANGSAAVEFARDILKKLAVLEGDALDEWYHVCKHGFLSE